MIKLSVACVIDDDLASQIQTSNARCTRAAYDVSVVQALRRIYNKVTLVSVGEDDKAAIDHLLRLRPDVVVNLAYASHPLEASFVGLLEILGLRYTGSSPRGIVLANDKTRSRHLLKAAGVRVPNFVELVQGETTAINLPPPLLVKPSSLASSAGINDDSLVKTPEEARKRAERIWKRFGTTALCDEFVVGREFRMSMIEASTTSIKPGAIIEWHFGTAKPGWGFRTEAIRINGRVQRLRQVTRDLADLPRRKTEELAAMARTAMKALDIRGYSTFDLRMDDRERVTVIEVNANPGLWSGSRLWTNPSFEATIKKIVAAALRRE